jgi:hypothetical protein
MLFLELALIRWLGSNIIHLSYFSNFVLLGSFLGVGLGFLVARKPWTFLPYAPVLLGLLIAVVAAFPVTINQSGNSLVYFTSLNVSGPPAYVVLPTVFVLVALVLIGPAEVVGRAFAHLEPLTAYRWDLVGSLIGIAGFSALSFLGAPPIVWGVVVLAGFIVLGVGKKAVLGVLALSIALTLLVKEGLVPGNEWSPYYKLNIQRIGTTPDGEPALLIRANGVPHQLMASADFKLNYAEAQYGTPYLRRNPAVPLNNVLIVGAGSGSDVAIALQMGAKHGDGSPARLGDRDRDGRRDLVLGEWGGPGAGDACGRLAIAVCGTFVFVAAAAAHRSPSSREPDPAAATPPAGPAEWSG